MNKCADCQAVLDAEDIIESLLVHEIVICPACLADRRQEDKADLARKDL